MFRVSGRPCALIAMPLGSARCKQACQLRGFKPLRTCPNANINGCQGRFHHLIRDRFQYLVNIPSPSLSRKDNNGFVRFATANSQVASPSGDDAGYSDTLGWEDMMDIAISVEGAPLGLSENAMEEMVRTVEEDAHALVAAAAKWRPDLFSIESGYDRDDESEGDVEAEGGVDQDTEGGEEDGSSGEEWSDVAAVGPLGEMPSVELSVVLCDDATIARLNEEWRGKTGPTDVLSFALMEGEDVGLPYVALGDVVVSLDTAELQARERGLGLRDEVRVLLTHGLLHLVGFDHETDAERDEMMAAERELMQRLGWKGTGLIASAYSDNSLDLHGGNVRTGRRANGSPGVSESGVASSAVHGAGGAGSLASGVATSGAVVLPKLMRGDRVRAIALDMDGTLLDSASRVRDATAEAIRAAVGKGVLVMLATGKARVAAERALLGCGLVGKGLVVAREHPGIFLQGLSVYGSGGVELPGQHLEEEVVRRAFEWAGEHGVALTSFHGDVCRTLRMMEELRELHQVYYEPLADECSSIDQLLEGPPVKKLLFMSSPGTIAEMIPDWDARLVPTGAALCQAVPSMLEIVPRGVNKGAALDLLLPQLGLRAEELMAVGDGRNDLEMIQKAGVGVAMGNAVQAVKDAADLIVSSHDEDGVAEAIARVLSL